MVKSQARRLVPSANRCRLDRALIRVSCTRSSASDALRLSDHANARKLGMSKMTDARQSEPVSTPVIRPADQARLNGPCKKTLVAGENAPVMGAFPCSGDLALDRAPGSTAPSRGTSALAPGIGGQIAIFREAALFAGHRGAALAGDLAA